MYAFCTYCSAQKSREIGEIPAIRRYQSSRIETVHTAASSLGLPFYILSGEFGLILPERPIPWYDHLLRPEEVSSLVELMASQIYQHSITGLVYFTKPLNYEKEILPYHDAIVAACSLSSRPYIVVEVENENLSN